MSRGLVNIEGIDKARLLAALFNARNALGMGLFQALRGPEVMDREQALVALGHGDDSEVMFGSRGTLGKSKPFKFDYLYGRPLKVDLTGPMVDPSGFDRDGSMTTFQELVDLIRGYDEQEKAASEG